MTIWRVCTEQKPNVDTNIILAVDEKSLTLSKAAEACDVIAEAKQKGYQAAVCFKQNSGKSDELQLIFMGMVCNNDFSIVEVDDLNDVDQEYAESVLEYQVEVDELKIILGEELGAFAEQLINNPYNPINSLVSSLIRTTIKSASDSAASAEATNDTLEAKIRDLEASLTDTRLKAADAAGKAENYKKCVDEQAIVIKRQNTELDDLKDKLKLTSDKLSGFSSTFAGQTGALTYVEMNVDRLRTKMSTQQARIDIEHVIYFKELTPCSYINSFIANFVQYIKISKKKNIICLIYDDAEFNKHKYGKLKRINGSNFVTNQSLKGESMVVVTDAAPQILEEALITHSIVIVYDRIGALQDIVVGRNVHKFAVVNSQKEMLEVKRETQLRSEQFITTFGTDKDTLSVRQIREYKQMSQGGRLMSYANMVCTKNNSTTVFEQLLFTANMNLDVVTPSL